MDALKSNPALPGTLSLHLKSHKNRIMKSSFLKTLNSKLNCCKHSCKTVFSITDDLHSSEKETTIYKCTNGSSLSPLNENIEALRNPLREVLSPIHSNNGRSHTVSSDPKTPKLRAAACNGENNISDCGTPLDIITARSSRLKVMPHFSLMICLLCLQC